MILRVDSTSMACVATSLTHRRFVAGSFAFHVGLQLPVTLVFILSSRIISSANRFIFLVSSTPAPSGQQRRRALRLHHLSGAASTPG